MLNDVAEDRDGVDFILVFKLSRFGRNAADVLNSLQYIQDFGVNLIGEKITADELYKDLLSFDRMYFKMTDLEKKRFMRDFIDEIELYPERQEDGRILKQLHLGFPVFYEGSEGDTIRLLKQNTFETICLLSRTDG